MTVLHTRSLKVVHAFGCLVVTAVSLQAAAYYATHEKNGIEGALRCLFLLSTGDDQVLPQVTTLLLAKQCGVQVDEKTLLGSLKHFYRFAGHGGVPYGDHRIEGLGTNGKDGMAAAIMQIASEAKGDVEIYKGARDRFARSMIDGYSSLSCGHGDDGRGDAIWRSIAPAYLKEIKPEAYQSHQEQLRWWYDLSRRPSGAFGISSCQSFDDEASGAGVALAYTAPLKTLRITGAPRSKYAKDFTLPKTLWGRQADPQYNPKELGPNELKHLKKGTNVLAVYANAAYKDNKEGEQQIGQFDLRIEGLRKAELLGVGQ